MIASFKCYPRMKDSGVRWLGEVPAHWAVRRLARIGRLSKGRGGTKDDEVAAGGVPCVRYGDLYTTHDSFIRRSRSFISPDKAAEYTAIRFGDALFAGSGETIDEIGKSAVNLMRQESRCGGDVLLFRPARRFDARYLGYALGCRSAVNQKATMGRGVTIMHIYGAQLRYLAIPVPPLAEQAAIGRFLDYADRRIQRFLNAKRKLIALLEEHRRAIIDQAATGRIDVRIGEPYRAYRSSSVSGLGNVPAHWTQCRLRNVVSEVTTGSRGWSSHAAETGPLFIRIANLSRGSLKLRFDDVVRLRLPDTPETGRARIRSGDLLISVTAYVGSIGVAPDGLDEAYVSQHVARCRPSPGVSPRWLGYMLLSAPGRNHGRVNVYGGTKDGLSLDDVKNYPILLPPRPEQERTVQWIDTHLSALVRKQDGAARQIEVVTEYRDRLIDVLTTGKLDVRAAASALPPFVPAQHAGEVEAVGGTSVG